MVSIFIQQTSVILTTKGIDYITRISNFSVRKDPSNGRKEVDKISKDTFSSSESHTGIWLHIQPIRSSLRLNWRHNIFLCVHKIRVFRQTVHRKNASWKQPRCHGTGSATMDRHAGCTEIGSCSVALYILTCTAYFQCERSVRLLSTFKYLSVVRGLPKVMQNIICYNLINFINANPPSAAVHTNFDYLQ